MSHFSTLKEIPVKSKRKYLGKAGLISVNSSYVAFSTDKGVPILPLQSNQMITKRDEYKIQKTTSIHLCPNNDSLLGLSTLNGLIVVANIKSDAGKLTFNESIKIDNKALKNGHSKMIDLIKWNPITSNILCSNTNNDNLFIWDLVNKKYLYRLKHGGLHFDWNYNGSNIVSIKNDVNNSQLLFIFDPRSPKGATQFAGFKGYNGKPQCFWAKNNGDYVGAVGTENNTQIVKIWDLKSGKLAPIFEKAITNKEPKLDIFFDNQRSILYTFGKKSTYVFELNYNKGLNCLINTPNSGSKTDMIHVSQVPFRAVDINSNEIACFYKLYSRSIEVSSFRLNNSDNFPQIYPNTFAGIPTITADEWKKKKTGKVRLIAHKKPNTNNIGNNDDEKQLPTLNQRTSSNKRVSSNKMIPPPRLTNIPPDLQGRSMDELIRIIIELRIENQKLIKENVALKSGKKPKMGGGNIRFV